MVVINGVLDKVGVVVIVVEEVFMGNVCFVNLG